MEKTVEFRTFIDKVSTSTPLTDGEFREILREGMYLLNLTDDDCARLFDVSRPTVTRWRNGSTAPVRAMRRLLSDVLRKEVARRSRLLKRYESRHTVRAIV